MFYIIFYVIPILAILGLLFAPHRPGKEFIYTFKHPLFWSEFPEIRILLITMLFACMALACFVQHMAETTVISAEPYEKNFHICIDRVKTWGELDVSIIKACELFSAAAQIEIINEKLVEEFKLSQPNKEVIEAYKQQLELLKKQMR